MGAGCPLVSERGLDFLAAPLYGPSELVEPASIAETFPILQFHFHLESFLACKRGRDRGQSLLHTSRFILQEDLDTSLDGGGHLTGHRPMPQGDGG